MSLFDAARYGPRIGEILALAGDGKRLMPLVGGPCVSAEARDMLQRLDRQALFAESKLHAPEFADAARAGLFLYLSCLQESHSISQGISSTTGSYWHGILHRQEPDFDNARYWFRRVRRHEVLDALRQALGDPGWDPLGFIDDCEQVHRRPDAAREKTLREMQRTEWQLLFDYSCRRAVEPS